MDFRWQPNISLDQEALQRIASAFSKPAEVVKTYRGVFDSFNTDPRETISECECHEFLHHTMLQIKIYGKTSISLQYEAWFYYLLPKFIRERSNWYLLEKTVSFLLIVHPQFIPELYVGFRHDLFYTLGNTIMNPDCWRDGDLSQNHNWFFYDEITPYEQSSTLNICLFFCLKYLRSKELEAWVDSLADIEGSRWGLQFGKWLQRFHKLIQYIENPSLYPPSVRPNPSISTQISLNRLGWAGSEFQKFADGYINDENLNSFWQSVHKHPKLKAFLKT